MKGRSTILVCTDFSQGSELALKAAQLLRDKTEGVLHVLHVSELLVQWDWIASGLMTSFLNQDSQLEVLRMATQKVEEEMKLLGIKGERHVVLGDPYQTVLKYITDLKADVVVLGGKGKGVSPLPLGSLAQKVVVSSKVPVFVIKRELPPVKVAGLVDPLAPLGSVVSAVEELTYLLSSRGKIISLVQDLGKFIEKEEALEATRSLIRQQLGPQSKVEILVEGARDGRITNRLLLLLAHEFADLVVMERHQKGFLEKLTMGSETRRLLEAYNGNFYILPPQKD